MRKTKLVICFSIIIGIFIISFTSANLIIDPSNPTITIQVNQPQNFTTTIFNNYSFDIYDLKFPELQAKGFTFPQIDIPKNTSKTFSYEVKTNQSFYGSINTNIQFKFLVDLPEEITTYPVQITSNGFNPTYRTVRQGDTIIWTNLDDITHDIYSTQFNTISIQPNQSNSYTFNNLGTFSYYDLDFNIFNQFNGQIEVVNRTSQQKAYNPNYNELWIINLNSVSEPTTISVSNSQNNYSINYASSKKGLITITNTGSKIAEKIKLTSNSTWISFNQNNIDLNSGDPSGIEYTITPYLANSNQTNKTYTINLGIKAFNTNQSNLTLTVFIPYHEISTDLNTDFDLAMWYQNVFCPAHPCSYFCSPELPECVNALNGINGTGETLTVNVTTQDLLSLMRSQSGIEDKVDRLLNNEKLFQEKFGISIDQALNYSNSSNLILLDNNKKQKSNSTTIWIVIIIIIAGAGISYYLTKLNKKSKKSDLLESKNWKDP